MLNKYESTKAQWIQKLSDMETSLSKRLDRKDRLPLSPQDQEKLKTRVPDSPDLESFESRDVLPRSILQFQDPDPFTPSSSLPGTPQSSDASPSSSLGSRSSSVLNRILEPMTMEFTPSPGSRRRIPSSVSPLGKEDVLHDEHGDDAQERDHDEDGGNEEDANFGGLGMDLSL